MSILSIRRAGRMDALTLAGLLRDFNVEFETSVEPMDVLADRFTRILQLDNVFALVAESEGAASGFALVTLRPAIWFDGPVATLDELYVVPALRDQGIGTALLAETKRVCVEFGSPEMHINVDEVDGATRRFYERHGFVTIEPGTDHRMLCYVGQTSS